MRTLVVLAGFAAVIGVATPARADPGGDASRTDPSFLAALDAAGITYQSRSTAIAAGKAACALMDVDTPEIDVINSVSSSNPGFTVDAAAKFTMIAARAYCPRHLGQPITQAPSPPP